MIDNLYIAATEESPLAEFNAKTGQFIISGNSISSKSDNIFETVNNWLDQYLLTPLDVSQLIINLDYFDISTSKHLLSILNKIKTLEDTKKFVSVEWHYNIEEDDMLELGQDYEMMVHLPFKFVGYNVVDNTVC